MKKLIFAALFTLAMITVSSSSYAYTTIYVKGSWDNWSSSTAMTYYGSEKIWTVRKYLTPGTYQLKYWIGDPGQNDVRPHGDASTNIVFVVNYPHTVIIQYGDSGSDAQADVMKVDHQIYNDTNEMPIKRVQGVDARWARPKITAVAQSGSLLSAIDVHYAVNGGVWSTAREQGGSISFIRSYANAGGQVFYLYDIEIPETFVSGDRIEYAITDGIGNWDNNDNRNYNQIIE